MQKVIGTIGYGFKIDRKPVLESLEKLGSYDDYYNSIDDFAITMSKYPLLSLHYSGNAYSGSGPDKEQEYVFVKDSVVTLEGYSIGSLDRYSKTFDIKALATGSQNDEAMDELFFMLGETGVGVGDLQWHLLSFVG